MLASYHFPSRFRMTVAEENSTDQGFEAPTPKQQAWLENMATEEQLS